MRKPLGDKHLLKIVKAKKSQLDDFKFGMFLQNTMAEDIDKLKIRVCVDRIRLAQNLYNKAKIKKPKKNFDYRHAVSRGYYCMYHSVRSLVYFTNGGDDHEEHKKLPTKIPNDFPNRDFWINELKLARLERNKADYDPYPRDAKFQESADNIIENCGKLLKLVKHYLKTRGCEL